VILIENALQKSWAIKMKTAYSHKIATSNEQLFSMNIHLLIRCKKTFQMLLLRR